MREPWQWIAGETIKVGQLCEVDEQGVVWLANSSIREPSVSQPLTRDAVTLTYRHEKLVKEPKRPL